MITNLNVIVKEWAYRVHDGKPNPNNHAHLYQLSEILIENKWSLSVIDELLQNLNEGDEWWTKLSPEQQAQYIKDHPNSDKAKSSKKARKGTDANRKKLSKRGYGIDSATGKAVKKSKKKEDPKKQNKHRKAVSKGIFPGSPRYNKFMRESVNEGKWSKIMKSVRKGSKAGPWTIVVYKGKKVLHQRRVKILQQIPAHYEDVLNLKDLARGIKIGIEDVPDPLAW